MRNTLLTTVLITALATSHAQHDHHGDDGGHTDHGAMRGATGWVIEDLVLRAGNAKGIEECVEIDVDRTITWEFRAEADLLVNFHLHPTRDGGYYTIYLKRGDDIRSDSGRVQTPEHGTYCFEFGLRQPPAEDLAIHLRYRID